MSLQHLLFSTDGRVPRSTFWYYTLSIYGVALIAITLDYFFQQVWSSYTLTWITYLVDIFVFITGIAMAVKRLHDRDHEGWYYFAGLIPLYNIYWLIELYFLKGTTGPNRFGSDPLGQQNQAAAIPQ